MQPADIIQVLSSPVWGGTGVIVSSVLSLIALIIAFLSYLSIPQPKILVALKKSPKLSITKWL